MSATANGGLRRNAARSRWRGAARALHSPAAMTTIDLDTMAAVTGGAKKDKWEGLREGLLRDLQEGGYPTPLEAFTKLKFHSEVGPNEID